MKNENGHKRTSESIFSANFGVFSPWLGSSLHVHALAGGGEDSKPTASKSGAGSKQQHGSSPRACLMHRLSVEYTKLCVLCENIRVKDIQKYVV